MEAERLEAVAQRGGRGLGRDPLAPLRAREQVDQLDAHLFDSVPEAAVADQPPAVLLLKRPAAVAAPLEDLDDPRKVLVRLVARERPAVADEAHDVRVAGDAPEAVKVSGGEGAKPQPSRLHRGETRASPRVR